MKTGSGWSSTLTTDTVRHALWSAVTGLIWMLLGWAYFWGRVGFTQFGTSSLSPWAETVVRIFLLPWEVPGQYGLGTRSAIVPFDASSLYAWANPILSFLFAATLIWFVSLLWVSLHSRRWLVLVLIAVVAVPHFYDLYQRTAFLQRLLPPTVMVCARGFGGKDVLRYDDLSPYARSVITETDFQGWETWEDAAHSFQNVPKVSAPLYLLALDRLKCGSTYTGTTVLISYNPRTLKLYRIETEEGRLGWP